MLVCTFQAERPNGTRTAVLYGSLRLRLGKLVLAMRLLLPIMHLTAHRSTLKLLCAIYLLSTHAGLARRVALHVHVLHGLFKH